MNIDIKTSSKQIENFFVSEPTFTNGFRNKVIGSTTDVYIQFNSNGTLTIPTSITADILLVGGGGGGGTRHGAGGGAGGLLYYQNINIPSGTHSIIIGNGGNAGSTGGNSTFLNYIAYGGGGGGSWDTRGGLNGGSGGGAGNGVAGTGISGQGNNGGEISTGQTYKHGGGGGAGGAGISGTGTKAGDGGIGRQINITGSNIYYAGGGGGGSHNADNGTTNTSMISSGGLGGGGAGGTPTQYSNGGNGTNGLGGGGGGASVPYGSGSIGGSGGSGVVIIRYNIGNNNIYNSYPILPNINPIVWYKFDDNSNNMLLDSGSLNNNLTNNGTTFNTNNFVKGNGSVNFSNGNYLDIPKNVNLKTLITTNGLSFGGWVFINSSTNVYSGIFCFGDASNYCLVMANPNLTGIRFQVQSTTININIPSFNSWVHWFWTMSTTGSWNIYINGVNVSSSVTSLVGNFVLANSQYRLGYYTATAGISSFIGLMDDFRIYDRVLTSNEVQELYTSSQTIQRQSVEQSTITTGLIDTSPVLTEDDVFNKNNRAYEYIHKYDINYLNLNSITPNTKIENGSTIFTKENSNIKYEYSSSNSASNNPTNLFNNSLSTNINNIQASFASNRYNSSGDFVGGSANAGDFISIEFPTAFKLKKYSFISKNINNAPASWIIYAGDDLINIEERTANRTDYNETLTKAENIYVNFLLTNEILAKKYLIVFKKTFGGTTLDFGQIKLEEGRISNLQATSPSSFPPEDNSVI